MKIAYPLLEKAGRLGNGLWEMASTLGIARAQGTEPVFPPGWSYRPFFSVPDRYFSDEPGRPAWEFVPHIDPRARQYLQDVALLKDVEAEVRSWFAASSWAEVLLEGLSVTKVLPKSIALHVRRGDNVHQQDFYPLPTLRYYERALRLLPGAPIVVFSDDIPWCRAEIHKVAGDRPVWFYEGVARPKEHEPDYMTAPVLDWKDLLLMARAPWHVTSNSTYSWWGAWLSSDPAPIYPSVWFGPRIDYIDASLMFPKEWRRVEVEP